MRWLSIDDSSYLTSELPAGYNLYVYCNNNPIMYEDNNGNFVITGLTILTAALIGAAGDYRRCWRQQPLPTDKIFGMVLGLEH